MKLGIVADEIDRDFTKAVRIGTQLGIQRYEIRNLTTGRAPMCDERELLTVEREGVEITALSPGLFKFADSTETFAREMQEIYPKAAEWAHRWKLPGLIVFGFNRSGGTHSEVVEWFAKAAECASADGLLLMIEPEPICWADTGTAAAAIIRETGADSLRINYDPGNVAWLLNRDPLDEFDTVAPFIANVHVKDFALGPTFLPAGEGIIDYRAHFAALRRIGYQGPISLEPHMDGSIESTRRCMQAVERLYSAGPVP